MHPARTVVLGAWTVRFCRYLLLMLSHICVCLELLLCHSCLHLLYTKMHASPTVCNWKTYQAWLAGGSQGAGGASTSESDESGHKLVFMWQARQTEAHFTEAVSGAQVYRSNAPLTTLFWYSNIRATSDDQSSCLFSVFVHGTIFLACKTTHAQLRFAYVLLSRAHCTSHPQTCLCRTCLLQQRLPRQAVQ